MHLLVSVGSEAEAMAALAGGADIVDVKDAAAGALGAVALDEFKAIRAAVGSRRPVTAAIGDATSEADVERTAFEFAAAGARFVKVAVAAPAIGTHAVALAAAAQRGVVAGGCGTSALVLVAYADTEAAGNGLPSPLIDVALRVGARGVLVDTADKNGPGLRALVAPHDLATWVAHAHTCGLFVAVAGKLTDDDLPFAVEAGADIAGVRGAACDGGRTGRVSALRVRQLRERLSGRSDLVAFRVPMRRETDRLDWLPFDAVNA